jgi:hypothetical protein
MGATSAHFESPSDTTMQTNHHHGERQTGRRADHWPLDYTVVAATSKPAPWLRSSPTSTLVVVVAMVVVGMGL